MISRTTFHIPESQQKIRLGNRVILMGSCFSENMGERFQTYKFDTISNPFGTIYNPLSIFRLLDMGIHCQTFDAQAIVEQQGIFYHFDAHSRISSTEQKKLLNSLNLRMEEFHAQLKSAHWLFITPGTAFVYEWNKRIVANCHKVPAQKFQKRLLKVDEILESFAGIQKELTSFNPDLKIVWTVSPVRHIREGIPENAVSKSILRLAIHHITEAHGQPYFPSYEWMLDDLRDYRYYERDMIHPRPEAIDYLWEKLLQVYFDSEAKNFIPQWDRIVSGLNHRPFHPQTTAHKHFLQALLQQIEALSSVVDTSVEKKEVLERISDTLPNT